MLNSKCCFSSPFADSVTEIIFRAVTDLKSRYLIHAPYGGRTARLGSWRALVEAQAKGRIRSIGVSNYGVHHLNELEACIQDLENEHGKNAGGQISVGQWELHPWLTRPDIVSWCEQRGVVIQAYCPLVRGQRLGDKALGQLAKKAGKTEAQVLMRWSLQKVGMVRIHWN